MPHQPEVVIVAPDGREHVFPAGFDPKRAAEIVRQQAGGAPPSRPADAAAQPEGQWSVFGRLSAGAKRALNFRPLVESVWEATRDPKAFLEQLGEAMRQTQRGADEAWNRGDVVTAGRKKIGAVVPMIGPWVNEKWDEIAAGPSSPAFWEAAGEVITSAALPKGVAKGTEFAPKVGGVFRTSNPVTRGAVEFAGREGIPLDAATATGNRGVAAVQHVSDRTIAGSMVADRAGARQAMALEASGRRLASRARPGASVAPEGAGAALRGKVQSQIERAGAEADQAYGQLRDVAARPENADVIQTAPQMAEATGAAQPWYGRTPDQIWPQVLEDARQHGFKGSVGELRRAFYERARQAADLRNVTLESEGAGSAEALLQLIRRHGGIKPFWRDEWGNQLRGDFQNLVQSFARGDTWRQRGGASIFRKDGLSLDDMVAQLKDDPIFGRTAGDLENFVRTLEDVAAEGPAQGADKGLGVYLEGAGFGRGGRGDGLPHRASPAGSGAEPVGVRP